MENDRISNHLGLLSSLQCSHPEDSAATWHGKWWLLSHSTDILAQFDCSSADGSLTQTDMICSDPHAPPPVLVGQDCACSSYLTQTSNVLSGKYFFFPAARLSLSLTGPLCVKSRGGRRKIHQQQYFNWMQKGLSENHFWGCRESNLFI